VCVYSRVYVPARACMHAPSKEEEEEEEEEEEVSCMHVRGARMRWLRFQGTSAAQDGCARQNLSLVRSHTFERFGRLRPSPTLSPTDPVPLGQLWPTGPMVVSATLYIGCI